MSLMRTLARVAVGVAAAKGAQHLMRNRNRHTGGGFLGSLGDDGGDLNRRLAGGDDGPDGGLGGLFGNLINIRHADGTTGRGPIHIRRPGGTGVDDRVGSGGLGGLLGPAVGGAGLGALLGGFANAASRGTGTEANFSGRLNEALMHGDTKSPPTVEEEAMAGLMIQAMIMAAKSDGRIDADERRAIDDALRDATPAERQFVESELDLNRDPTDFARGVPDDPGVRQQVYMAALTAIDLDNRAEAQHLDTLAQGLGLDHGTVNDLHAKMGVVSLYE